MRAKPAGPRSEQGDHAGRGLFAARDIPAYSSLDMRMSVNAFHFLPSALEVMEDLWEWAEEDQCAYAEDELESVLTFAYGRLHLSLHLSRCGFALS